MQAELQSIQEIAPSLFKLALKPEAPFAFKAGQFVIIPLPPDPQAPEGSKPPKGFYSIASSEEEAGLLELLIEHREGYVSGWMTSRKPGEKLGLEGPLGKFGLQDPFTRTQVFWGGKAGMAPLRSMILSLARSAPAQDLHLFAADPLLEAEWRKLEALEPRFHYHLGGEPAAALKERKGLDIYLAGFNREVEPMLEKLLEAGFEKDSVKVEKFG
jgi:NAD(P)H-flavin reductase